MYDPIESGPSADRRMGLGENPWTIDPMHRVPVLFTLGICACGGPPSRGTFDALTYNVAGLPEGASRSMPAMFTPKISVRLNRYDLVLVQEDFSYHHLLTVAAKHPYQSPPLEDFGTFVNDGLNRFSQGPLGTMTRERWPQCFGFADHGSDCLSSKGWSFSQVEVAPGVLVHVYNHHAEAGGAPEDDESRVLGYQRLAEVIAERSAGHALIVGGDTNLHQDDPDDEPVLQEFLSQTGLTDACRSLSCGDDRIDRFLFRPGDDIGLTALAWRVADEMVTKEGGPLSDHLAVHTQFEWRHLEN